MPTKNIKNYIYNGVVFLHLIINVYANVNQVQSHYYRGRPTEIDFGAKGIIHYFYDATGRKLRKVVTDTIHGEVLTDYLDGFQYKDKGLQFFPTAEGYVNISHIRYKNNKFEIIAIETEDDVFNYVYNYTDHLGNIRMSYGIDPSDGVLKVIEENHYYPFGLKHSNYNSDIKAYVKEEEMMKMKIIPSGSSSILTSYNYKYNGKELQDELGLNLYDYGARLYDPARAGWSTVDPLAEKFPSWSPYSFCYNNPLRVVDPDGREGQDWVKKGNKWSYVESITTPAQATAAGYDDFRANGSILSNARIGSGSIGDVCLGAGGNSHYATAEDYALANDGKSFGNSFWNGNQGGAYLYSGGFSYDSKYAGISGNHQFLTASAFNNTGTGYLPLALDLGGSVSGATGSISGRLGTSNFGAYGNANGSIFTADGNISAGIFTGEGNKKGLMLDANIGAYAAKGEYTLGGTLGGFKFQQTIGGSLLSAHAGWSSNFYYNGNNGSLNIEFQENLGWGLGEKYGFKIQIPLPFKD